MLTTLFFYCLITFIIVSETTEGKPDHRESNLNDSQPKLSPVTITEPADNMTGKEVLSTMENLMSSMSSGDWTNILPDDFYSLIDNLQDMQGLDQTEIDLLEESYTKYLKTQGAFDYLEQDDFTIESNLFRIASANSPSVNSNYSNHSSPCQSPHPSPVPALNTLTNPNTMGLTSHHNRSPIQSLTNSFSASLLDTNSLDEVLKGGMYTNMNNIQTKNPTNNNLDVNVSTREMMVSSIGEINNNNMNMSTPRLDNMSMSTSLIDNINTPVSRVEDNMNITPPQPDIKVLISNPSSCYVPVGVNVQTTSISNVAANYNLMQRQVHKYVNNANKESGIEEEDDEFDWSTIL